MVDAPTAAKHQEEAVPSFPCQVCSLAALETGPSQGQPERRPSCCDQPAPLPARVPQRAHHPQGAQKVGPEVEA